MDLRVYRRVTTLPSLVARLYLRLEERERAEASLQRAFTLFPILISRTLTSCLMPALHVVHLQIIIYSQWSY